MRSSLFTALLGALPAVMAPQPAAVRNFHAEHVLGATFDMAVVGPTALEAARAQAAALAEIARLDRVLSSWRGDSELAVLNRSSGPHPVSPDLYRVIEACEAWRAQTGGAFNGRLGSLEAVWDGAGLEAPTADALTTALVSAQTHVRLDPAARTVDRGGAVFAIDALAKGYIVDAALTAAFTAVPAIKGALLNIGGDMACRGSAPGAAGWRIGIAPGGQADNAPAADAITLNGDRAVASSGPGSRDRLIGGQAFSRTLDPATGAPAGTRLTTVIAPTAAKADALATSLSLMPPATALAFARSRPGVEARIVDHNGLIHTSAGWPANIAAAAPPAFIRAAAPARGKPWPNRFVVSIGYIIYGGVEHPPLMVIYITDAHGALIRTVGYVGKAPERFLDSNFVWFAAWRKKTPRPQIENLTHPTKPPGRYHVIWDGLDDAGRPVPQGRYTINIEASREKGGHGVQRIVLDLGDLPTSGLADPAPEAGPASARYGINQ